MKKINKFLVALCIGVMGYSNIAMANVTIDPKRVVFFGRERTAQVNLINSGDEEAVYRVFFQETIMDEEGNLKVLKDDEVPANHPSSSQMIKYSPRRVTIPAHSGQVVRLMLRKPKDLAEGEYRSNIVFQGVPDADKGANIEKVALKKDEVRISITPIFGISIPAIVRHGDLTATASISDIKLSTKEVKKKNDKGEEETVNSKILNIVLNREGNRSLYGGFTVDYQAPNSDEKVEVGRVKGIAIYTNVTSRDIELGLNPPEGVTLKKGGTLFVKYEEDPEMGGDLKTESSMVIK